MTEFSDKANLRLSHGAYNAVQENADISEHDHYNMDAPSPAGDDLAGRIRRIQNLIDQRQSVEAIALAVETLQRYNDMPDTDLQNICTKIEDSMAYINIHGTQHEADITKRMILQNINLSSRWGDNLIEHIELGGFASIISALRAENTSDVNAPSIGVNREVVPTLSYTA